MIDLKDGSYTPSLEEIGDFIRNPLFEQLCKKMVQEYRAACKIEFSKCSWEPGWNIKFKKSGKSLCTIYPRENSFTVQVVVGKQEKEAVEAILPELSAPVRERYAQTREGNGQKWLMIELEDEGEVFQDVLCMIAIRSGRK